MTTTTDTPRPVTKILDRAPAEVAMPIMISREGELALREELADLLSERDDQLPRRLRRAREFGVATENDDYLQILEEEEVSAARIRSIRAILASARVVDPSDDDHGVAGLGSVVTLRIAGKQVERRLLGAHEPIGSYGVSAASPIGRAILGTKPGEAVTAELPSGESIDLEIVAVQRPGAGLARARRRGLTARPSNRPGHPRKRPPPRALPAQPPRPGPQRPATPRPPRNPD